MLEKLEGLPRAAAIARYLALAGIDSSAVDAGAIAARGVGGDGGRAIRAEMQPLDWPAAVAKFSGEHVDRLARWRGISPEFFKWLQAQSLIGLCKQSIAFPVHDGRAVVAAHIRPESGRWFYSPRGVGCHPLFIGDRATASKTMLFESQWDAFAIMDAAAWHHNAPDGWAVLITRGASNGRLAARAVGAVYAWPQNDPEKEGKRAGEEWLRDVAEHAPGDMFRVSVPAQHKDVNDWTRAEALNVWDAINGAPLMEDASRRVPLETSADDRQAPPVPFDPAGVLDDLGLYWLNGSPSYFLRRAENRRALRFLEMGAGEVRRKLRVRGFGARPDADAGENVSQIDRVLDAATETRAVDFAVSIGGTPAGFYDLPGGSVLVRESPRLVQPLIGDWPNTEGFLTALFGQDAPRFCSWLKIGYEALIAGERRPGQALIIIGPPDCVRAAFSINHHPDPCGALR